MHLLRLVFWLPIFMVFEIGPADLAPDASLIASGMAALGIMPIICAAGAFYVLEPGAMLNWVVLIMGGLYLLLGLLFDFAWQKQFGEGFLEY